MKHKYHGVFSKEGKNAQGINLKDARGSEWDLACTGKASQPEPRQIRHLSEPGAKIEGTVNTNKHGSSNLGHACRQNSKQGIIKLH